MIDARFRIPRPAAQQHWTAYQAVIYLTEVVGKMGVYVVLATVSALLFCASYSWVTEWLGKTQATQLALYLGGALVTGILLAYLGAAIECMDLLIPFRRSFQRSTYGTAQWADTQQLEDMGFARRTGETGEKGEIILGRLGTDHNMILPADQALLNMAFFGPPGAGKSKTFLMTILQEWAKGGSAIILDPKGELYEQTAHLYEDAFCINLSDPSQSDRWNFIPDCAGNVRVAREIGFLLASADEAEASGRDPFWKNAEKAGFAALLNLLASGVADPRPSDLAEMIALSSIDSLNSAVMASTDIDIQTDWGSFTKLKPETQANVLIGMSVICSVFIDPVIKTISTVPTQADLARGVRSLDLRDLRKPGTAVYVVIPEGRDKEFQAFLAVLFGLAAAYLRDSSMGKAQEFGDLTRVLFILDELANLPAVAEAIKIAQLVSMGRGRRMLAAMGFQSKSQMYDQLGRERTDSILGSVGTFIFLPGITDQVTLEWASQLSGQTTVWQHTSVDVMGSHSLDSSRSTEVGRSLVTTDEIRRMIKYEQALALISNVPPIRFRYPPMVAVANPPKPKRHIEPGVEEVKPKTVKPVASGPSSSGGGMGRKSAAQTLGVVREQVATVAELPSLDAVFAGLEKEEKNLAPLPPQQIFDLDPTLNDAEVVKLMDNELPVNHLELAF